MKYTLRSLFVVMTLCCAFFARIPYLHNLAHKHEQDWHRIYEEGQWSRPGPDGSAAMDQEWHHHLLALRFRIAANRPWTIVDENTETYSSAELELVHRDFSEAMASGMIKEFLP